jgi:hypothetical protein
MDWHGDAGKFTTAKRDTSTTPAFSRKKQG